MLIIWYKNYLDFLSRCNSICSEGRAPDREFIKYKLNALTDYSNINKLLVDFRVINKEDIKVIKQNQSATEVVSNNNGVKSVETKYTYTIFIDVLVWGFKELLKMYNTEENYNKIYNNKAFKKYNSITPSELENMLDTINSEYFFDN